MSIEILPPSIVMATRTDGGFMIFETLDEVQKLESETPGTFTGEYSEGELGKHPKRGTWGWNVSNLFIEAPKHYNGNFNGRFNAKHEGFPELVTIEPD